MVNEKSKTNRFVGLFLLANFLFSYPVMTLFNAQSAFWGIPIFFFFMFMAWLLLIVLMIICVEKNPRIQTNSSKRKINGNLFKL